MGNVKEKIDTRLSQRQKEFDSMRNVKGFKRPGSRNKHKNSRGQGMSAKRR